MNPQLPEAATALVMAVRDMLKPPVGFAPTDEAIDKGCVLMGALRATEKALGLEETKSPPPPPGVMAKRTPPKP